MLNKDEIKRYDRQLKLAVVGNDGQEKLKHARVLVIGAGGLGCPALQYLAAAGLGHITVIDGDTVSESNLQRQILFTQNDLGKPKAETAANKIRLINSFIEVKFINEFLSVNTALALFSDFDLILDCCDNFGTRYLINDICTLLKKPFIAAALFRTEAQLGVFNVQMPEGNYSANYREVFPESSKSNSALDCNEAGVIATLPGLMGVYQANEAIKYFIDKANCCINKIMIINCWNLQHFFFDATIPDTRVQLNKEEIVNYNYQLPCATDLLKIIDSDKLNELLQDEITVIVDVREAHELPVVEVKNIVQIPLSVLENNTAFFKDKYSVVFVCKSGIRSKKSLDLIEKIYPGRNFYSYKHGIESLLSLLPKNQNSYERSL